MGWILSWFGVLVQLYLILENRTASVPETLLRFFTFFTILSNILVAICFTASFSHSFYDTTFFTRSVVQGAVTVYILIVGAVYNLVLRFLWNPQGLQMLVDELLHTVVPIYYTAYWFFFVPKDRLQWSCIPRWLIFPAIYLITVLVRGAFTGYYPYPFLEVTQFGYPKVLLNALYILAGFIVFSVALIGVARKMTAKKMPA